MTEGIFLGDYLSSTSIQVDLTKIEVILRVPTPKTLKEVHTFLGKARYYRQFIENFAKITLPLYSLIAKDKDFECTDKRDGDFLELKKHVTTTPILRGSN